MPDSELQSLWQREAPGRTAHSALCQSLCYLGPALASVHCGESVLLLKSAPDTPPVHLSHHHFLNVSAQKCSRDRAVTLL